MYATYFAVPSDDNNAGDGAFFLFCFAIKWNGKYGKLRGAQITNSIDTHTHIYTGIIAKIDRHKPIGNKGEIKIKICIQSIRIETERTMKQSA